MQIPLATYRIQFTSAFNFASAKSIVSYLAELGITDLYASPIFTARQGSTHGYDVVNPQQINPELGGREAFEALVQDLQENHIGWVQDIVPNHMAYDNQNHMLMDALENGFDSQYHNFFDIDWNHPFGGIRGRALAPFLGRFYGDCLESGELQLRYGQNGLSINYYALSFPLRIESYSHVLMYDLGRLRNKLGRAHPDFVKFLGVLYALKYIPSGEEGRERYDQIAFIKRMLWELWNDSNEVQRFIEENIEIFNGEAGNSESFNLLDNLLSEQFFRLSYWKVGNEELNYRRFFTVNELISLRIEEQNVFDTTHSLILQLVKEGKFKGLRVDHIDGLYDPAQYLNRLREHDSEIYITVEKILEPHEDLPLNWPIQGTTGYDFMSKVNCLFCQQSSEAEFDSIYYQFIGKATPCDRVIDETKRLIIGKYLAGDIDNLAHLLKQIADRHRYASDFTMYGLKRALVEILTVFPVYRTYISREGTRKADQDCMKQVLQKAKENIPNFSNELFFIEKFLLLDFDDSLSQEDKELWLHFLMRMQQYTGPLMAKGVEDTAFYVYNRLISLNEVGSSACQFGISVDDFHSFNQNRWAQWPHAANSTATHDTKRGEDVRARINVLSEIPQEWESHVKNWSAINAPLKEAVNGSSAPAANDEYLLYQTLLGAFPFDPAELPAFVNRTQDYVVKAVREAKVHSTWMRPEIAYENAFTQFIERLLEDTEDNLFLQVFRPFQKKIQHYGVFNSLSQTLLKITSPGVPDLYQGTELWDLSLVDPDNRRPVDFELRTDYLKEIKLKLEGDSNDSLLSYIAELLKTPEDGRIKMFLTYRALQVRQNHRELFQRGGYEKLTVLGSLKAHVVAFARDLGDTRVIAIVPRLLTSLIKEGEYPFGEQVWHETRIVQPPGSSSVWQDAMTGREIQGGDTLWLREILTHFPVALLVGKSEPVFELADSAVETFTQSER
ncbi:malto-oligosyltrehalose synthase [Phormidium tenue FACHB-886]|nr:malto-oligosyltrehalose synthase [Phormidium tenue FACHB-886]